ncbi:F-box/kelch-repeat protein At1g23390 [Cynara cardunculus var. scolymus]|uniref:F-box domain, cyclin-like protein n=1 Tax=Cynara cardunculus var. scolymus TaxID=59895 RepID=A0A124SG90_CYNCS|nr:F-box/kelch-repeat protein At1g23390 [Cynara cardunculus var. scolymus]KVI05656.1 F-box domain, cyclin-like protein [Cynara cardunculus var. scolymus]
MPTSGDQSQIAAVAAPFHSDVLEAILSHLPLIHLVQASLVSKTWYKVISFILLKYQKSKPWLILHTQYSRSPYLTTTEAYDPASNLWIEIHQPSIDYVSPLRSSQLNLLYMLSPSKLSFSFDPLHLTWHHTVAPRVWRIDPIVAVVGKHVVVAGGACDFEQDPLAVEIYDIESQKWTKLEPMPEFFKESASSTFHSIASDDRRLFVMEKNSGVLHTFDPVTNTWYGPYDLHPDHLVFHSSIGFSNNRLILIGMLDDCNDFIGIKLWEVNWQSFEFVEIAEMPADLVAKLKGDDLEISSIEVRIAGNVAYIYKPWLVEEVIVCEFSESGKCRWRSTTANSVASDRSITERFVFTCSMVGIEELRRATLSTVNRRFRFKR